MLEGGRETRRLPGKHWATKQPQQLGWSISSAAISSFPPFPGAHRHFPLRFVGLPQHPLSLLSLPCPVGVCMFQVDVLPPPRLRAAPRVHLPSPSLAPSPTSAVWLHTPPVVPAHTSPHACIGRLFSLSPPLRYLFHSSCRTAPTSTGPVSLGLSRRAIRTSLDDN